MLFVVKKSLIPLFRGRNRKGTFGATLSRRKVRQAYHQCSKEGKGLRFRKEVEMILIIALCVSVASLPSFYCGDQNFANLGLLCERRRRALRFPPLNDRNTYSHFKENNEDNSQNNSVNTKPFESISVQDPNKRFNSNKRYNKSHNISKSE